MKVGLSLQELGQRLQQEKAARQDFLVTTTNATILTPRKEGTETPKGESAPILELKGMDGEFVVTDHFLGQVADRIGVSIKVLKRWKVEHPDLLDNTVNTLFRREPQRQLIRTFDWAGADLPGGQVARAFLSDRYRPLDNAELAEAILPELYAIPDLQIVSCDLTDRNFYLKATTPRVSGDVKVGDTVQAGLVVKNSEVGSGALSVQPWIFTLACTNGMVSGKATRTHHLGRILKAEDDSYDIYRDDTRAADDKAIFLKLRDAARAAVSETVFQGILTQLQEAAGTAPMLDPTEGVKRIAKKLDLSEGEGKSVLLHLAAGGDMTLYGAMNAVTRTAEDVESYDRASELEKLGGDLLDVSRREWEAIAA